MQIKPITPPLEQGSGRWWMRVPMALVEGEMLTPMARVGVISDFCNGVGQLNLGGNVGMINADISLQLHRIPQGVDWARWRRPVQPNGIGATQCRLFDENGEVGYVMQKPSCHRPNSPVEPLYRALRCYLPVAPHQTSSS